MNEDFAPISPANRNLRRRDLLVSATVTAGALAGATEAMAQPAPVPGFRAPSQVVRGNLAGSALTCRPCMLSNAKYGRRNAQGAPRSDRPRGIGGRPSPWLRGHRGNPPQERPGLQSAGGNDLSRFASPRACGAAV